MALKPEVSRQQLEALEVDTSAMQTAKARGLTGVIITTQGKRMHSQHNRHTTDERPSAALVGCRRCACIPVLVWSVLQRGGCLLVWLTEGHQQG